MDQRLRELDPIDRLIISYITRNCAKLIGWSREQARNHLTTQSLAMGCPLSERLLVKV